VPKKKEPREKRQVIGVFGVGLDGEDGHQRVTRNEDVMIVGGSEETHEQMQEISIKFNESLKDSGKRLHEAEVREVLDMLHKALENVSK
jgi:hypothetical protein